jgi:hypothetical protein
MNALDNSAGGVLMDPYLAEPLTCICERYSVSETRERGGYCTFEMTFAELGSPGNFFAYISTANQTQNAASNTGSSAAAVVDNGAPLGQGGIGHA